MEYKQTIYTLFIKKWLRLQKSWAQAPNNIHISGVVIVHHRVWAGVFGSDDPRDRPPAVTVTVLATASDEEEEDGPCSLATAPLCLIPLLILV